MQETPARTNALISNNSWTYVGDNTYNLAGGELRRAVRDALPLVTGSQPVLFVFAAGNDGGGNDDGGGGDSDTILSPGTSKNVITVGALEQLRNITNSYTPLDSTNEVAVWAGGTDSGTQVAGYSGRGNVGIGSEGAYGRFKPDVVAPGSFVVSTRSQQWDEAAYYNPTNYYFQEQDDQLISARSVRNENLSLNFSPPNVTFNSNIVAVKVFILPNLASPSPFPEPADFCQPPQLSEPDRPASFDFVVTNTVSIPRTRTCLSEFDPEWEPVHDHPEHEQLRGAV
ncbi:MAG: S8 family serine peptidase [Limisphaerales bacterium]